MRLNNIFGKITDKNPAKYRGSLLLALVFFYFVFHLITGERGLLAYVQLKGEIESQKKEFILTQRDKDRLASRVVGLRSESLD
ncbi:MAG: hypothetical protein GW818_03430, partial [Flavobacteriales bacterium]|nr:hypothetical protein [Flavobacteriales bacterium]